MYFQSLWDRRTYRRADILRLIGLGHLASE